MIDCGVVQAVVRGIAGASWQLKMRSLAFVCHFDSTHQVCLICKYLTVLIILLILIRNVWLNVV